MLGIGIRVRGWRGGCGEGFRYYLVALITGEEGFEGGEIVVVI
jgi:hypothetical protein